MPWSCSGRVNSNHHLASSHLNRLMCSSCSVGGLTPNTASAGPWSRCQWMPMCRGRAETTTEPQGLHDLESRAELFLCCYMSLGFTPPTQTIYSQPVGHLNRQQPIQDRPALAAVGFVGVCMWGLSWARAWTASAAPTKILQVWLLQSWALTSVDLC